MKMRMVRYSSSRKKNDEFKEKSKTDKPQIPINDNLLKLQIEFTSYITENRLEGLFSKEGKWNRS